MAPHLPIGNYKARAVLDTADFGVAKTGTRQIAVEFEVIEGSMQGKRITWYGYFSPTMRKDGKTVAAATIESLQNAGCKFADGDITDLGGLGAADVMLVVDHDTDDKGTTRAKVQWVNKLGGVAMANRMSDADKRAFAASMRGSVIGIQEKAGAKASAAPTGGAGEGTDDVPWG